MARPIRLLQVTDTHLYSSAKSKLCGIPTADSLAQVLTLARSENWPPDAILATGDLSQDETPESYRRFIDTFSALGVPVHCLAGNHDVPTRMVDGFHGSASIGVTRRVELGAWQALLLNTSVPNDNAGELSEGELTFLEKSLRDNPGLHTLVTLHHNPVPVKSEWLDTMQLRNSAAFFAVIERFPNVKAIVFGHVHQEYDAVRNGVRLLATPSTCLQFLPHSQKFAIDIRPPGYRWLMLQPDGKLETGVRRLSAYAFVPDLTTRGY